MRIAGVDLTRQGVPDMDSDDPRFRIAAARRMLARADCDSGVAGHVSERVDGEDAFWVSPFGYFDETTPDMASNEAVFMVDEHTTPPARNAT